MSDAAKTESETGRRETSMHSFTVEGPGRVTVKELETGTSSPREEGCSLSEEGSIGTEISETETEDANSAEEEEELARTGAAG